MGIATFSPFILATHVKDSLPCIVVGLVDGGDNEYAYVMAVDGDGVIEFLPPDAVRIDWRYNPATELWSGGEITREEELGD